MGFGLFYWILMILWLVFGMWSHWPSQVPGTPGPGYRPVGNVLLLFVLFFILGWKNFGPPVHP
jgi:hypothetical protein